MKEQKKNDSGSPANSNSDHLTSLDESNPAEALDKILTYNAGAFSSDTVFQQEARNDVVKDIKKISKPAKGD